MPRGIPAAFADQASRDELKWRQLLTRTTPVARLTITNKVNLQNFWKHAVKVSSYKAEDLHMFKFILLTSHSSIEDIYYV